MKKEMLIALTFVTSVFGGECEDIVFIEKNIRELPESTFSSLIEEGDTQFIIKLSEGDTFPLDFSIAGSLIESNAPDERPYSITLKQDLYIRMPKKNKLLISTDKKVWKSLFQFITGNLSINMEIEEDSGELLAKLALVLYQK